MSYFYEYFNALKKNQSKKKLPNFLSKSHSVLHLYQYMENKPTFAVIQYVSLKISSNIFQRTD